MSFDKSKLDPEQGIILPIDKPYRWTSADVIRKVKYAACRYYGNKKLKVGHAGTLDPLATGILLVCIGKAATKQAEELQRSPKEYIAGVTFGATTPSYDLEKDIDRLMPFDGVSEQSLREKLPSFLGEQMQVAPLFSAKSVDGVRAYETARKLYRQAQKDGVPFDFDNTDILQANPVNIYDLELKSFTPASASMSDWESVAARGFVSGRDEDAVRRFPSDMLDEVGVKDCGSRINVADISGYDLPKADIRVGCSKGTYIRAFARDLGESLGTGAFLHSLRRTKNGGFTIEDSVTIEEVLDLFKVQ